VVSNGDRPIHNALIDKIISAPLHILVSMRAKTEWVVDRDDTYKSVPRKVGLALRRAPRLTRLCFPKVTQAVCS
jgi:hypothetical protein